MEKKNFSDRLRSALDYRQKKPIDLTNGAGLNKSLVSGYMNNKYEAKNDKIDEIAKYLDISQLYLIGLSEDYGNYEDLAKSPNNVDDLESIDEDQLVDYSLIRNLLNSNDEISILTIEIINKLVNLEIKELEMILALIKGLEK